MTKTLELKELQGKMLFSGIDRETVSLPRWEGSEQHEDAERVTFILDNTKYCATEDPSDGYRSSMKSLTLYEGEVKNTFEPVEVFCTHRNKGRSYGEDDILEIRRMSDAEIILEIGTDNIDDYYPSFVCNFNAEKLGKV